MAHLVFERLSSSLEHAIKTEEDEKKRGQSRPARNEPSRHRAELKLPRKSTGSRKTGLGWKVGVPSYWSTFALPGISLSPAKKDAIWKSWGWRGSGSKAVKRFCLHLKKEEKEDVESINLVVTDWSTSRSLLPAFAKRLRPRESIPPPFLAYELVSSSNFFAPPTQPLTHTSFGISSLSWWAILTDPSETSSTLISRCCLTLPFHWSSSLVLLTWNRDPSFEWSSWGMESKDIKRLWFAKVKKNLWWVKEPERASFRLCGWAAIAMGTLSFSLEGEHFAVFPPRRWLSYGTHLQALFEGQRTSFFPFWLALELAPFFFLCSLCLHLPAYASSIETTAPSFHSLLASCWRGLGRAR